MPWDDSPGGGFTGPGVTPWLPMADHPVRTVAAQRDDPESVLGLCRRLLALRRAELGGGIAEFENLPAPEGQWVYRVGSLVVAANFTGQPAPARPAAGEVLLTTAAAAGVRPLRPASWGPGRASSRAKGGEGPAVAAVTTPSTVASPY